MHFQSYKNAPLQGETQSSLLLRRQCQQDGGHHSPKNEETALQAGRREVQEGVKVKFPNDCDLVHYFTVSPPIFNLWIAWKACPLHDCESEYP